MGLEFSVEIPKADANKLKNALKKYQRSIYVRAGVLENATNEQTGETIAGYAAANEFGTSRIPARPFMRSTLSSNSGKWVNIVTSRISSGGDFEDALELAGAAMASDIQETISSNMPPENAASTVLAKQREVKGMGSSPGNVMSSGTLIDTGSLLKSINYEVTENDEPS